MPLIRFHGVLAPNAKLGPQGVPQERHAQAQAATEAAVAAGCEADTVEARPHRISWARLLKRLLDIDLRHCPNCDAGELKIIAAIIERRVVEKILTHPGLDPQPPQRGRAREAGQDQRHLSRADRHGHLHPLTAAGSALRAVCTMHADTRVNPEVDAEGTVRAWLVRSPQLARPGISAVHAPSSRHFVARSAGAGLVPVPVSSRLEGG